MARKTIRGEDADTFMRAVGETVERMVNGRDLGGRGGDGRTLAWALVVFPGGTAHDPLPVNYRSNAKRPHSARALQTLLTRWNQDQAGADGQQGQTGGGDAEAGPDGTDQAQGGEEGVQDGRQAPRTAAQPQRAQQPQQARQAARQEPGDPRRVDAAPPQERATPLQALRDQMAPQRSRFEGAPAGRAAHLQEAEASNQAALQAGDVAGDVAVDPRDPRQVRRMDRDADNVPENPDPRDPPRTIPEDPWPGEDRTQPAPEPEPQPEPERAPTSPQRGRPAGRRKA